MDNKDSLAGIYVAVFLVSAATLLFELAATRYYAITQWHHLAYMVVSIALLGFGVSGTLISIIPVLREHGLKKTLLVCSLLFSATLLSSFVLINKITLDPYEIVWNNRQILNLALHYLFLTVPYVFSGLVVGLPIVTKPGKTSFFYAASMAGSSVGCLIPFTLLKNLPFPGTVFASLLMGLASAVVLSKKTKQTLVCVIAFSLVSLVILNYNTELNISQYKTLPRLLNIPDARLLATRWGPDARVDAVATKTLRYAPGLSTTFNGSVPEYVGFTVDGDNLVSLVASGADLSFIDYLPSSLPYGMLSQPKTLILSGGMGLELLSSAYYNSSPTTVVEENKVLYRLIMDEFWEDYEADLGVNNISIVLRDNRNFLAGDKGKYDLIVLPLNLGQVQSTGGVYSQTESYAYTKEAFREYLRHLSGDGLLATTRWLSYPPREDARLTVLAVEALEDEGVDDPGNHVAVIRTLTTYTLLLSRREFTKEELTLIREFAVSRRFDLVWLPGMDASEANRFNKFAGPVYYESVKSVLEKAGRSAYVRDYIFDVSAPTDDKPFFFNNFRWRKIKPLYDSMGGKWEPFFEGGFIAVLVFLQALVFSVIFIVAPLTLKRNGGLRSLASWLPTLSYFLLIGIGFMFVEITLIQKFILPLGKPTYSLAVVLSGMLSFSGLGSIASNRITGDKTKNILLTLALTVLLYSTVLPSMLYVILGKPLTHRILYSTLSIAPLAFLMGFPFPLGVKYTACSRNKDVTAWAWAVNGAASVAGAVLAVISSTTLGYNTTLFIAGLVYATAGFLYQVLLFCASPVSGTNTTPVM